jgi:hypothetical protein
MALTAEQRRRYARQVSLAEIGEAGQERLCDARFRLPPDADPRAAEVARGYLVRAGLAEAPTGVASEHAPVHVSLPGSEQVRQRAGAVFLEPPTAALEGALAAVEALKSALGVGTPAPPRSRP